MENEKDNRQSEAAEQSAESESMGTESASKSPLAGEADAYQKLLQEKQELYERLLRKQAEVENFRKRIQREKEEFLQHATSDLVRALLPTLDGFERALKHGDAKVPEQFYKGIELIYKQLADVLGRAGLTPIETAGKIFDPHLHQAVETVESQEHRDHEILEELQKGYKLRQRLLRPAIVRVAVGGRRSGDDHGTRERALASAEDAAEAESEAAEN
jgi:molecular chaperone GrpE